MAADTKSPKNKTPKYLGALFIKAELCKGCGFCIDLCPSAALAFSREYNRKGYHYPVLASEIQCNGCDLCGLYCPDFSIFAVRYLNPAHEEGAAKKEK